MKAICFGLLQASLLVALQTRAPADTAFSYDPSGNLTTQTNVGFPPPPAFQSQPRYLSAESSGVLSVCAPVTGVGPFTYKWLLNGVAVTGATNDCLEVLNAATANLGNYQLVASNAGGAVTSAVITVSFDTDHNGLPDAWEMAYFGHLGNDPNGDPDGDGVSNLQEYLDGTNPVDANSAMYTLNIFPFGGSVSRTPSQPRYFKGTTVTLTAAPTAPSAAVLWGGSLSTTTNPLNLTVTTNLNLNATMVSGMQLQFSYSNFSNTAGLNLTGTTTNINGFLRLTPNVPNSMGSAWPSARYRAAPGFLTRFSFEISPNGGDGLSFVLQNAGNTVTTGESGIGLAVSLNTYQNPGEPSDNFVGVFRNGILWVAQDLYPLGINMSDGLPHDVIIWHDGTNLTVMMDNTVVINALPVPLAQFLDSNGYAWPGFGGRTGAASEDHDILNWSFYLQNPPLPTDLAPVIVVAPASVTSPQANPTISVAWDVTNQGAGTASDGWYDGVWFSTNGVLDGTSVSLGNFPVSQIVAPGSVYWQTNSVTLPMSASGNYWLFVQADVYNYLNETNRANNISAAVPGVLHLPPVITTQPVSQTVDLGSTVAFSVSVNATPPVSFQWFFNGGSIGEATNLSITLSNAQPASSGGYKVIVTNAYGAATSSIATLVVFSNNCTAVPAGLVAWWRGESNALDEVGLNNGVSVNGVGFTNGMVSSGFAFSGGGDYVSITAGTANLPVGTSPRTVEAWVKTTMSGLGEVFCYGAPGNGQVFDLGVWGASIFVSGWASPQYTVNASVNDGAFHHLALVYDGTNASVLFDGRLLDTRAFGINTGSGAATIGSRMAPLEFFNGIIDEVSIYNRALGTNEIAAIYGAGRAGKCAVSIAPSIVVGPRSQSIVAGSNVFFSVVIGGSQPLSFRWQKNGINLSDGGAVSGAALATLTLTGVTLADAGNYAVVITNALGSAISGTAYLAVLLPSPALFYIKGFTNEADIGISSSKSYVHLLDWGASSARVINGVALTPAGVSGPVWNLSLPSVGFIQSGPGYPPLTDFYYDAGGRAGDFETLTLSGLMPGGWYETRFYVRAWGTSRPIRVDFVNGTETKSLLGYDEDNSPGSGPDGQHFLALRYQAQVTNVVVTFTSLTANASDHQYFLSTEVVVPPRFVAMSRLAGGSFQLSLSTLSNLAYRIEASTNLLNWVTLASTSSPSTTLQFIDLNATNYPARFYRALWVP